VIENLDESAKGGFYHEPVLVKEAIGYLLENKDTTDSKIYVDCTLGGGGYTKKILEATSEGLKVAAIDKDVYAIEHCKKALERFGSRVIFIKGNFGELKEILDNAGYKMISGIVMDLGLSTYQLGYEAGFSYQRDTELDMRADKDQKLKAKDILNKYDEKELGRVFYEYGELRYSRKIASDIVNTRENKKFETTFDLVELMKIKTPARYLNRDLSKLFQAIRIEVNSELRNLERVLDDSLEFLESGAKIAAVSYHSLEDRIVKNFFRQKENLKIITKKPVEPTDEEIDANVKARSAKLRVAEKI
jgi:16S rRNA (cytosine1402-N4)-methyltransferase